MRGTACAADLKGRRKLQVEFCLSWVKVKVKDKAMKGGGKSALDMKDGIHLRKVGRLVIGQEEGQSGFDVKLVDSVGAQDSLDRVVLMK